MDHLPIQPEQFTKPTDDYLRVSTLSPEVAIADVPANVDSLLVAYDNAKQEQAELVVMPELCVTGYSTADLFHNQHVLEQTEKGLLELAKATEHGPALAVGAPLRHNGLLYNCGVLMAQGKIAGVVPKTHLPNYKEFYEYRWFTTGGDIVDQNITIGDQEAAFGTDILFELNGTKVGMEICEDLFAPISPSQYQALRGAEVIINLSASNELINKADYRRFSLIGGLTGSLICAYVYCSAGRGESIADLIYGGHQIVGENGHLVAERAPFSDDTSPLTYDIDRTYLQHDRMVNKTFSEQAAKFRRTEPGRIIHLRAPKPNDDRLLRRVDPDPFVPSNPETLDQRCEEIFNGLAHAMAQLCRQHDTKAIVIGLSGGLDSALAALIAMYTADLLDKDYDFIHTLTMPGPASSDHTQDNATLLAEAIGTTHKVIPIIDMARITREALVHDGTQNIAYENIQARQRTALLMNYANMVGGFVQGTGDMSENAIGWCTFNGDHMSMFNPNTAIPKTLVKHLVKWYAENRAPEAAKAVLLDIVNTPITPELTGDGDLSQVTEAKVGPYRLNDFEMYEHLRFGSRPTKIGYLAKVAFQAVYDDDTIAKWLDSFMFRHTVSQWKRDVTPNGTKYGTVAQSPRGDLRMAPNTSTHWYE